MNFENLPESNGQGKRGKFIRPGIQNLILRKIFLHTSSNTGNQRPVFSMETEPITDEGWEGFEDAKGQIGNIAGNFGFYLKDDNQKLNFAGNLKDIMKAVGTYDAFLEKYGKTDFDMNNVEALIDAVQPFIQNKVARYFVSGEQYQKIGNVGVGLKLKFPSRKFVEALDSQSTFPAFDESNPNHFKKLAKRTEPTSTSDGLPFL